HRARYAAIELGERDAAPETPLVPQHEGVAAIAAAHQVLGEIEPRLGEPVRPRHLVAVREHARAPARGDDAAEVPDVGPELLRVVDRPAVELGVAVQLQAPLAHDLARELRNLRFLDRAFGRQPENRRGGHTRRSISCGLYSDGSRAEARSPHAGGASRQAPARLSAGQGRLRADRFAGPAPCAARARNTPGAAQ